MFNESVCVVDPIHKKRPMAGPNKKIGDKTSVKSPTHSNKL